jgi:hypothetical protein
MLITLTRLHELLQHIDNPRAADVASAIVTYHTDREQFWRDLNTDAWWAGAGSLAAETVADNPGLPEAAWNAEMRELRELMIDVGNELVARGGENPGVSSWLLAMDSRNRTGG